MTVLRTIAGILVFALTTSSSIWASENAKRMGVDQAFIAPNVRIADERVVILQKAAVSRPSPGDNSVAVLDRDGSLIFQRNPGLDIPNTAVVSLVDTALVGDRTLVVSATTLSVENQGGWFLLYYDIGEGRLKKVVRSMPLACKRVFGSNDGGVWCLGSDILKDQDGVDYDILHRFAPDGAYVEGRLPRSMFPTSQSGWLLVSGESPLDAAVGADVDGRVHVVLPYAREGIVVSAAGNVEERYPIPGWPSAHERVMHRSTRWVLSSAGELFAQISVAGAADQRGGHSRDRHLLRLSSDRTVWEEATPDYLRPWEPHMDIVAVTDRQIVVGNGFIRELVSIPRPMTDAGRSLVND